MAQRPQLSDTRLECLAGSSDFSRRLNQLDAACARIAREVYLPDPRVPTQVSPEHSAAIAYPSSEDLKRSLMYETDDSAVDPDRGGPPTELRLLVDDALRNDLARPHILTVDDVFDSAFEHLLVPRLVGYRSHPPREREDDESVVPASDHLQPFWISLEQKCRQWFEGESVRLATGRFGSAFDANLVCPLGKHGLRLSFTITAMAPTGQEPIRVFHPMHREVFGQITGLCSSRAMESLRSELDALMKAVLICLEPVCDIYSPVASKPHLDPRRDLVRTCIDCYFSSNKNSDYRARIRNALRLVMQADRQRDEMLAITLGVAGIEALLLENDGSQLQWCEHVATLLQPNATERDEAAEVVKRLYKARSRFIHGDASESDGPPWWRVRDLVSAVLAGALFAYQALRDQSAKDPRSEDLFVALRKAKRSGSAMPGVPRWARLDWPLDVLHVRGSGH